MPPGRLTPDDVVQEIKALTDRKRIPRDRKSFDVKAYAEKYEREYLAKFETKIRIITDRRTLLELVDIWYRYHGVNLADGDRRKRNVERMAVGMSNPMGSELTPEMFLNYRYNRTQKDEDRVTGKTFNNQHGYLNAVYRRLFRLKVIDYDSPIAEVEFIKLQEGQTSYLSHDDIDTLFNLLKSDCGTSQCGGYRNYVLEPAPDGARPSN
jgi:hypothetical protein